MLFSRDMRPSMIPYMLIYLSERTWNIEIICYPESGQNSDFSKTYTKQKLKSSLSGLEPFISSSTWAFCIIFWKTTVRNVKIILLLTLKNVDFWRFSQKQKKNSNTRKLRLFPADNFSWDGSAFSHSAENISPTIFWLSLMSIGIKMKELQTVPLRFSKM